MIDYFQTGIVILKLLKSMDRLHFNGRRNSMDRVIYDYSLWHYNMEEVHFQQSISTLQAKNSIDELLKSKNSLLFRFN